VVSVHSIANLFYILRREMDPVSRKEVLSALQIIFRIEDTRGRDLIRAVELGWEDYEDAVRSVVAERIRADFLVTRNTKDYADSRVPVITPEEFLRYENIP
ncbi:MAG: PIN domain-containing protein, partial [Firmicutes bacterium]|nr:PIN domain-containing protein [Bacillota bacterium]